MADREYLNTNPAGKLVLVLERIRSTKPSDNISYTAWSQIFETPNEPVFFTTRKLENLIGLISTVYEQMNKADYPKDFYDASIMDLHKIISISVKNLSQGWSEIQPRVSDDKLGVVKACAAILDRNPIEKAYTPDQLNDLEEKTKGLMQFIDESGLPKEVKERFINLMHQIIDAIVEYRVFGLDFLVDKYTQGVGELAVMYQVLEKSGNEIIKSKIMDYLKDMATIIAVVKGMKELSNWAAPHLHLLQQ
jgi:hypothetical protein